MNEILKIKRGKITLRLNEECLNKISSLNLGIVTHLDEDVYLLRVLPTLNFSSSLNKVRAVITTSMKENLGLKYY